MKRKVCLSLVLILVIAALSFGLVACKKSNTTVPSELKITFDGSDLYTEDSLSENPDLLSVELLTGDTARTIEYKILSSSVTEDEEYLEVVISAAGIEKTVRLPYAKAELLLIRPELRSLYKAFAKTAKPSVALTLSGAYRSDKDAESAAFGMRALLNAQENGIGFSLLRGSANAQNKIANYDDAILSLGGIQWDEARWKSLVGAFLGDVNLDLESLIGLKSQSGDKQNEQAPEKDDLLSRFTELSSSLDFLDKLISKPALATLTGLSVKRNENGYVITTNSAKLIGFLKTFASAADFGGIDLDQIFDLANGLTNGALENGDISIGFTIERADDGARITASLSDKKTGAEGNLSLALALSETPFSLPNEKETTDPNIEIDLPLSLPQKGISLELKAILHLSNIFSENGKDLITGSVDYDSVKNAVRFVLNDG